MRLVAGSREDEGDGGRSEIQGFGSWVAGRRPIGLRENLDELRQRTPRLLSEVVTLIITSVVGANVSLKRAVFVVVVVVVVIVEWTMVDTDVFVCLLRQTKGCEAWIQDTGHWRGRKRLEIVQ